MTQAPRPGPGLRAEPVSSPQDAIAAWDARLDAAGDVLRVAGDILPVLVRATEASRGSLMTVNRKTGCLRVIAAEGLASVVVGRDLPPSPRRISDWVLRERRGLILNGTVSSERFEASAPRDHIASAMSVPVVGPSGPAGVLNLARVAPAAVFSEADLAGMQWMASNVAAILERVQELEAARTEWGAALSRSRTRAGSDEEWNGTHSCRVAVARVEGRMPAGDVFEHISNADGGVTLMLADPFGMGSESFRVGELIRGLFLAHARYHRSPATIVEQVHEGLVHGDAGQQAKLWIASMSPAGQLASCNAGYPPALCVSPDGVGHKLVAGGPPAGSLPGPFRYEEDRVRQLPGDAVVVVSDGLLGVRSAHGEQYDLRTVEDVLDEHRRLPLERLVRRLCDEAIAFGSGAGPVDDVVALALRYSREE